MESENEKNKKPKTKVFHSAIPNLSFQNQDEIIYFSSDYAYPQND